MPIFGVIILVHELGHFVAAKAFGVRVHEFAIGFGPQIAGLTRGETRYSLRLFLILGGFVRMAGMEDGDVQDPRGFAAKPIWQRMMVIFAGPLMNFVLAALIWATLFYVQGEARGTQIAGVLENSPAMAAGIQAGDRILSIDGQPITQWVELQQAVEVSAGREMSLRIARDGAELVLSVSPRRDPSSGHYMLGIMPAVQRVGLFTALWRGSVITVLGIGEWFRTVWYWIQARIAPDVAGPVGIIRLVAETSRQGFVTLAQLAAILSINIGIINLIPIPALDGSRLAFLTLEAARGRRMDPMRENMIHFVGLMLLLGMVLLITLFKDIPGL